MEINKIFEFLKIKKWRKEPVKNLSRGLQKRFDIARVLIHNPDLLLFDEPFSGLDITSLDLIHELVMKMRGEKTIIISTHNIKEAKDLLNRAAFLAKGKLIHVWKREQLDETKIINLLRGRSIN